jgi:hypothetical protein
MLTIPSIGRSDWIQRFALRRSVFVAALVLSAMLTASTVRSQDCIVEMREAAKAWAMHQIAVIQAERGNVQGAKQTVWQIDAEREACEKQRPSDVTGVWFCNGRAIYDHPPGLIGPFGYSQQQNGYVLTRGEASNSDPSRIPAGLPPNWLAPDPRHGVVVSFTDEYDSHGTRVTTRNYADGYAVIETPHADENRHDSGLATGQAWHSDASTTAK